MAFLLEFVHAVLGGVLIQSHIYLSSNSENARPYVSTYLRTKLENCIAIKNRTAISELTLNKIVRHCQTKTPLNNLNNIFKSKHMYHIKPQLKIDVEVGTEPFKTIKETKKNTKNKEEHHVVKVLYLNE